MMRGLSPVARVLGPAGLLPQALALAATFHPEWRYIALAAGYFYASLIFSFLGGLWWGTAAARADAPGWIYGAAVVPSLLAFASGIPWMIGTTWPGPSLGWLGFAILVSVLVDRRLTALGLMTPAMLRLRWVLSIGLGVLTMALAFA